MSRATRFFDETKNSHVAVIGTGVSNHDVIKLFLAKGYHVTLCDKKSPQQLGDVYDELKNLGADFSLGENYLDAVFSCDMIVRTPGMYYNNPVLTEARKKGIAVTSEMELFFDLCPCRIYAVTGSDGKTTTTTLISEMLSKADRKSTRLNSSHRL